MRNPDLTVCEVSIEDLIPYANNAKIHTNEQVEQILRSIQEFGFNDPVAAWHNCEGNIEIVEGHGRILAAKKLGLNKIPVVFLDHLSDMERRAYTHVHNQLTMNTGWDFLVLERELSEIEFDFKEFGFDMEDNVLDIDSMFEEKESDLEQEDEPKKNLATCPNCGEQFEV